VRVRVGIATGLVLLLVGGFSALPAAAHNPSVTEFQSGLSVNAGPWGIVDGDDGKLWFTTDTGAAFGPISAGDGLISQFTGVLLTGNAKGISAGPDGNLWIAEAGGSGAIARVTRSGAVTEFTAGLTPGDPWDITEGPDGNLWFVGNNPAVVGRITPAGVITEFTAGLSAGSAPTAIAAGPDGNLWFTESANPGRIGRITPAGVITENSIGLPANMAPTDIVAGPDNAMWFTLRGGQGAIGRIDMDGRIKEFRGGVTSGSAPTGIAVGTDDALWFTQANSIGRITADGKVTEYAEGLTPNRSPWQITAGPDGNMWFTENANPGALARISLPPWVRTGDVQGVSDNSVRLAAKVRPNAQATQFLFQYGTGKSFRLESDSGDAGNGWEPVELSMRIPGLKPATTYNYRVAATNDSGTTTGQHGTFTTEPLAPEAGKAIVADPAGRVRYKRPGKRWRPLPAYGAELPVGVKFDTRRGSLALTSANRKGVTQTGRFGGGIMQVRQPRRARGRVDVYMRGGNFGACRRVRRHRARGSVLASASRTRRVRRLWGNDSGGRYRTHGRHSHATVRGTKWVTIDRCDGTLTIVREGAVVVRDFARHRRVLVTAGHRYLARKRAHRARRRH
jgi:streptogramin lyase